MDGTAGIPGQRLYVTGPAAGPITVVAAGEAPILAAGDLVTVPAGGAAVYVTADRPGQPMTWISAERLHRLEQLERGVNAAIAEQVEARLAAAVEAERLACERVAAAVARLEHPTPGEGRSAAKRIEGRIRARMAH